MKPAELKYNERSWAIDIISYINNYVDSDSIIKRAGGEFSISGGGQALFPDVILFGIMEHRKLGKIGTGLLFH